MIKVLNADWLLADENNFAEFCNSLASCNSGRIYDCDLLRTLANANWEFNQNIIIRYCFIPWALYSIFTIFSYQQFLVNNHEKDEDKSSFIIIYEYSLIVFTILLMIYQLAIEFI